MTECTSDFDEIAPRHHCSAHDMHPNSQIGNLSNSINMTGCSSKGNYVQIAPRPPSSTNDTVQRPPTLVNALLKVPKPKPFICGICEKSFVSSGKLEQHMLIHTGEKPLQCVKCDKTFAFRRNLTYHMKSHAAVNMVRKHYSCDVCQKSFISLLGLKNHSRIHTGEEPFKCDVCGRTFVFPGNLNVHKRIHTGKKPYQCDVCQKAFTQKCQLKVHQKIHTGEKAFECGKCQKRFREKASLNVHWRRHTGEKPYVCDVCDKRFACMSGMKSHKRVMHPNAKVFQCKFCNENCSSESALNIHLETHKQEQANGLAQNAQVIYLF